MSKRGAGKYHGYLVIDKPGGWTSHDVVGRIRRVLNERRVGHAGTLDPAAVGVLPVAVGDATRTIEYLADASKSYVAEVTLGLATDSYDGDGRVTRTVDPGHIGRAAMEQALDAFRGQIAQVPPMYSAVQVGGRRLHELARAGLEIERAARPVTINELEIIEGNPPVFSLFIDCSKGTYVRALVHDLGERLGTGAYLSNLVRVRTGPFTLADAVRLDQLPDLLQREPWPLIAVHPDVAVHDRDAAIIDPEASARWRQGSALQYSGRAGEIVRVYDGAGVWLGIGQVAPEGHLLRPVKVVAAQ